MGKGTIPKDFIEQLLAQTDIVQVINQRVPLKKAGKNYVACCPFHKEKTPSFNVNPFKQFYHCFGCGASGDAIRFLQEYDGLSFTDAVEALAQQAGLTVPYRQLTPQQRQQQKKQATLYEVLAQAARFYRLQLRDHPQAEVAKAYLKHRGLTSQIAKTYYLGYAPPGWDSLRAVFHPMSQYEPLLIEAGLRVPKAEHSGSYDRFRNRIIFPIRDVRGQVVGFGGRVLADGDKPKYLNSPENPLFHKSQVLYGLYELLQRRDRYDHIIVVEGYMDVIALAQHGFGNVVATLGTAVTAAHLDQLYRHVDRLVFSFDGDAAGLQAAWKAVALLLPNLTEHQSAQFLLLPTGEDPDSLVRQQGAEALRQRIAQAPMLVEFVIQQLQAQLAVPLSEQEGRRHFLAAVTPWLKLARGWYQAALLEQAAGLLGLRPWQLARQLDIYVPLASNTPARLSSQSKAPPVLTLAHRIVRHLLYAPQWAAELFSDKDLPYLRQLEDAGGPLLAQVVEALLQGEDVEQIEAQLQAQGQQLVLQALRQLPLPESEAMRRAEFEGLLQRLLEQHALAHTQDLKTLMALKKPR
ncbi:MAG TPA: DNA primase [Piscirickettsiaceae bacterium]|nr:DNA primase [Piscirickettsiaceae bacterium]